MLKVVVAREYEDRLSLRRSALGERSVQELSGISGESATGELFEKAASSPLFGGEETYLVRGAFAGEGGDALMENLEAFVESPHLFVFEEESLTAPLIAKMKKVGAEVFSGKKAASVFERTFNTFALADALGKRDKKSLWMLMTRALRAGIEPEEVAGVLHWQARSMLAASHAQSAAEANMKDFVYSKSKRYAGNFRGRELADLSRTLMTLYHDAHRGRGDLSLLLERFALSL